MSISCHHAIVHKYKSSSAHLTLKFALPKVRSVLILQRFRYSFRRPSKGSPPRDGEPLRAMKNNYKGFPILKDLVLLGGGHAHVEVIRSFGMDPIPGVRLTLITKDVHTAYSGMLPGFVAGYYDFDECHVDLARLASMCRVHFVHATAKNIDTKAQKVILEGREPLGYDVLSIDVGITPSGQGIPGSLEHSTPVKPVSSFVERLELIKSRHMESQRPLKVVVVGGGAGGVELTMSMHHYLTQAKPGDEATAEPTSPPPAHVTLLSRSNILPSHPAAARTKFLRIMKEKGIMLREGFAVTAVEEGKIVAEVGGAVEFDECLWCTQAGPPLWLKDTGLPTDKNGFLAIDDSLQCSRGPANVFACGDVAGNEKHPRPKAGVFAVRQGPPLAANLRSFLKGQPLQAYTPQQTGLGLITTGDKYAIATKGWFCIEGAYLWNWKDKIDRTWMAKYRENLPVMEEEPLPDSGVSSGEADMAAVLAGAQMRCGGCGAKVGATVLSRALERLSPGAQAPEVVSGLREREDAALVDPPPPGHLLVHTVDFFRSFISDPYRFGAVAANNALGDCHAMGAQPRTALAIAVVPFGSDARMEETLYQLMAGALGVLREAGCSLVGGHTCEGDELALGFAVNGWVKEGELMRKGGACEGQALVLTKAVGTGVLMAANMRGKAKGRWVQGAISSMQQSSGEAARCLHEHGATCCTDVTGFGLLGHLQEVALASKVSVEVSMRKVPLLEGAFECAAEGVASSLAPQNSRVATWVEDPPEAGKHPSWPLLIDPQTGGGLLASLPREQAAKCVEKLKELGYLEAAIIGSVMGPVTNDVERTAPQGIIRLMP